MCLKVMYVQEAPRCLVKVKPPRTAESLLGGGGGDYIGDLSGIYLLFLRVKKTLPGIRGKPKRNRHLV